MKKLLSFAILLAFGTVASAATLRITSTTTDNKTGDLTVAFTESGLGNNTQTNITLTGMSSYQFACYNNGTHVMNNKWQTTGNSVYTGAPTRPTKTAT